MPFVQVLSLVIPGYTAHLHVDIPVSGSHQLGDTDVEEYDAEEDLGYVREPIRWQADFQSQELRYQDESQDALRLYHQAKASQEGGVVSRCHLCATQKLKRTHNRLADSMLAQPGRVGRA